MTKLISIIAAVTENNGLGKNNDLLCHVPGDLKRFKEITTGHAVVMGRKTYESLPRKPLPNRKNIVISTQTNLAFEGCTIVQSITEAMNEMSNAQENFIIGGAKVYELFLPYAQKLYLTHIHKNFDADVFFPQLNLNDWVITDNQEVSMPNGADFNYKYTTYVRKGFVKK